MITGSNFVLYILTHYVEEIDTYYLLQITKSTFNPPKDDPTYGVTTLLPRGKTSEELRAREELSDENLAEVINLFSKNT